MATMNGAIPEKKANGRVNMSERKLKRYFPARMTASERERIILELLEDWKANKDQKQCYPLACIGMHDFIWTLR